MLKAMLFTADAGLTGMIRGMADESNEFSIVDIVEWSPTGYPTARAFNLITPDVILLDVSNPDRDLSHAAGIHEFCPTVPMVGLAARDIQPIVNANPEYGLTGLAVWPFDVIGLERAIANAVHNTAGKIYQNLVVFLPGKAGSGATSVVLHTAVMAAKIGHKVLVLEGDLHSGVLATLLNLKPSSTIRHALAAAPNMDEREWTKHVATAHGVDFLLSEPAQKEPIPSWTHFYQLLRFATPRYALIMVDLPEVVNSATAEPVRASRCAYVVSTPELPSLKLSHYRCKELEARGLDGPRIQVVLNRWHQRSDMPVADAEEILEHTVAMCIRNDYRTLQQSILRAVPVDGNTELGEAYTKFAHLLTGTQVAKKGLMGLFRK